MFHLSNSFLYAKNWNLSLRFAERVFERVLSEEFDLKLSGTNKNRLSAIIQNGLTGLTSGLLLFFLGFSPAQAQVHTGYQATYYFQDCNSIFNCAGQPGFPNAPGFPGCSAGPAPSGGGNTVNQFIAALGLTDYAGGANCGKC